MEGRAGLASPQGPSPGCLRLQACVGWNVPVFAEIQLSL